MAVNPFKPTAGKLPPVLIGRQPIIDDFVEGLDNGAGAPGRLMLVTGQRGYGKTVLLAELRRVATKRGWTVFSETASVGMCERLVEAIAPRGMHVSGANLSPSVTVGGVMGASLGGLSFSAPELGALPLRKAVAARLKKEKPGCGIVITVDEAQAASADDIIALATTFQHILADQDMTDDPDDKKRGLVLVFAVLPSMMDDLLDNKVLTFLRRAQKEIAGQVLLPDVRDAYVSVVEGAGKRISTHVAHQAALAAGGHPYLVQLVGYYMWRAAEARGSQVIEQCDVQSGRADAMMAFYDAICAPLYYGLRSPQRLFIEAMAQDADCPSRMADIAQRAGRTPSWASKYRASLIREHVIEPAGFGLVKFASPHMGQFIRDQIFWHD